jgi:hypothetical protein
MSVGGDCDDDGCCCCCCRLLDREGDFRFLPWTGGATTVDPSANRRPSPITDDAKEGVVAGRVRFFFWRVGGAARLAGVVGGGGTEVVRGRLDDGRWVDCFCSRRSSSWARIIAGIVSVARCAAARWGLRVFVIVSATSAAAAAAAAVELDVSCCVVVAVGLRGACLNSTRIRSWFFKTC